MAILLALFIAFIATIHGFLARSAPVAGEILVVEAWFWERPTLSEVVDEFRRGYYEYLVVVGQPSSDRKNGSVAKNEADLAADRLIELGLGRERIFSLTTPDIKRHKTLTSAVVFREWMKKNNPELKAINVFTIDLHARRSQRLFRKVLGPQVSVGVIAGTQTAYVPWRWWSSPTGIKLVAKNLFGYLIGRSLHPLRMSLDTMGE